MGIRFKRLGTDIVANLSGRDQQLTDADHAVLRDVRVLRIDPSNTCNATCVFCESSFNRRSTHLALPLFADALGSAARSANLETIQFGCTFEPTIRKDLAAFGEALANVPFTVPPAFISLVTNGWLLHRHNLEPFVRAGLNKLHVSLHAHRPDEFREVMGRDRLDATVANLRDFKGRFPQVPISAVCVVNRLNQHDPAGFARWAFEEAGVDYLRFTRANIVGDRPASPAREALEAGNASFEVSDAEWDLFVERARTVEAAGLDILESEQNLKNSAFKVAALRVKRRDAPTEITAMRTCRAGTAGEGATLA